MSIGNEVERLLSGPIPSEQPEGLLAQLVVHCSEEARTVLDRVREVLVLVLSHPDPAAYSVEHWRSQLPVWFVRKCAPEITQEEAERRRHLPFEQRVSLAQHWSLGAWLHWFRPNERPWKWWDADITSPDFLRIRLVVPGFPFASGALEWLLLSAGAEVVERVD
jgi:hypothetical protein